MRTIEFTTQFKKDIKREKRGKHQSVFKNKKSDFWKIIEALTTDKELDKKQHDHQLSGNWKDHHDCHIKPDLVLIYRKTDNETLQLV